MSADRIVLLDLLAAARRRRTVLLAATGALAGVVVAVALLPAEWARLLPRGGATAVGAPLMAAGALSGWWRARRDRRRIAYEVELRAPQCRNLLVTAAELAESPDAVSGPGSGAKALSTRHRVRPEIARLVESQAADLARRLDPRALFPLGRALVALAIGVALWGGLALAMPSSSGGDSGRAPVPPPAPAADEIPGILAVEITVTPPAYSGLASRTLRDPVRIEVLEGSELTIVARASGDAVVLAELDGSVGMAPQPDGSFRAETRARADGYLAFEARLRDEVAPRRFVGLVVVPDALPLIRIVEPGEDRFLPRAEGEIPIVATAEDDLGLEDLRVTYTIVSGSGENFEFSEGEFPVGLQLTDGRAWSATTRLMPATLGLGLGDTVVYRAVGRDSRPGAPEVESDAFVVEIVGDDAAIAGGFALESDEEREALSQRMIIIKTERLLEQRGSMGAEDYAAQARRIAAEQRLVRAEFVFMMGGEVQDEVEEAEHEHEIAEGRLELRGRQEMSRAVLFMSQAAAALIEPDLAAALPLELEALEALQSALARSRYILRTMADRESIDMTRRLTASGGAGQGVLAPNETASDPELAGLRELLSDLASEAATRAPPLEPGARGTRSPGGDSGAGGAGDLARLAETAIRIDPSSPLLQEVAEVLVGADSASVAERLSRAIDSLTAYIEARLPLSPPGVRSEPGLAGALLDALNRTGGG